MLAPLLMLKALMLLTSFPTTRSCWCWRPLLMLHCKSLDAAHVPATNSADALATLLMLKPLMLLASFILLIASLLLPVFAQLSFCML
jgi:hypothetical protein